MKKHKVYLPKLLLALGLISSTVFLIPTLITAFSDEPLWVTVGFFLFSLLGASLIIAFFNCRISYDENEFSARSFFGIKRSFTYEQVTAIKENTRDTYIYIGKRRVMIDEISIGGSEFVTFVKSKYRKLHNGKALPAIPKNKQDIFNGNVNDTAGFVAGYIIMGVFILAFAVFCVWHIYFSSNANTVEQQLTFKHYATDGDDVILYSSDSQLYKIRFTDNQFNKNSVKSICDGKTTVTAYSKKITPDDEDDYYSVKAIFVEDTCILSFEETERLHIQEYKPLVFVPLVMAAVWGTFVVLSIMTGRNPKKFSKRFVKLFFKDGYIKY